MPDLFVPGNQYERKDIFRLLKIDPAPTGGNWFTGYHEHNGEFYLFVSVGVAGRTGHDYANRWLDDKLFEWYGKETATANQPQSQAMLSDGKVVRLFTRTGDRASFEYQGKVAPAALFYEVPFRVHWRVA